MIEIYILGAIITQIISAVWFIRDGQDAHIVALGSCACAGFWPFLVIPIAIFWTYNTIKIL